MSMKTNLPKEVTQRIELDAHETFIKDKRWKLGSSDRNKEKAYIIGATCAMEKGVKLEQVLAIIQDLCKEEVEYDVIGGVAIDPNGALDKYEKMIEEIKELTTKALETFKEETRL